MSAFGRRSSAAAISLAVASIVAIVPALASSPRSGPQASPDAASAPAGDETIKAVSARTASDAWAVGGQSIDGYRTVIRHWDGTGWTRVESPNTSTTGRRLQGVAAVAAHDAWAVGSGNRTSGRTGTLIEHWDGSSWTIVPSPNRPVGASFLSAVSATSATDAWAVGSADSRGGPTKTLIEHWDGSSWTIVPSPSPGRSFDDRLYGVSARSATDAWAVGYTAAVDNAYLPLILHWDGRAWTRVPCPWGSRGGEPSSILTAVSALSASKAWAVGYRTAHGVADRTLIVMWNGTKWTLQPSPKGQLNAVDAVSPGDVWAVGSAGRIQHWDGTSWTRTPSLSPHYDRDLYGVSASSGSNAWAVGDRYTTGGLLLPLIDQWNGAEWTELSPS